jgi:hypothetical protein
MSQQAANDAIITVKDLLRSRLGLPNPAPDTLGALNPWSACISCCSIPSHRFPGFHDDGATGGGRSR